MGLLDDWKLWWKETESERPEYDLSTSSTWRVASKYRNPEDGDWWFTNGYKFYENWVEWRWANPHMVIAQTKEDKPQLCIELEMNPVINGVTVKMYLDRVFYDTNNSEYVIVDVKTGKTTPKSSLQLAFYSYGLRKVYGIEATKGYYWMAREGELSQPFDLAGMDDDKIETLVNMFDLARKNNIFLPNFDHCNMCGYSAQCEWYQTKGER
jgi:hypothetical protein